MANKLVLDKQERQAVDKLKKRLINPLVLAVPRVNGHYTVDTDAANTQVKFMLLQEQEDKVQKPIGYWSRSVYDAERWYDKTHRECLAMVGSVLFLRLYLEGSYFVIRKDH